MKIIRDIKLPKSFAKEFTQSSFINVNAYTTPLNNLDLYLLFTYIYMEILYCIFIVYFEKNY